MTFHADKTSGNVVLTVEEAAVGYDDQILSEPIPIWTSTKMNAVLIIGTKWDRSLLLSSLSSDEFLLSRGSSLWRLMSRWGYYDQIQSNPLTVSWMSSGMTLNWHQVEIHNRLGAFLFSGDDVQENCQYAGIDWNGHVCSVNYHGE